MFCGFMLHLTMSSVLYSYIATLLFQVFRLLGIYHSLQRDTLAILCVYVEMFYTDRSRCCLSSKLTSWDDVHLPFKTKWCSQCPWLTGLLVHRPRILTTNSSPWNGVHIKGSIVPYWFPKFSNGAYCHSIVFSLVIRTGSPVCT